MADGLRSLLQLAVLATVVFFARNDVDAAALQPQGFYTAAIEAAMAEGSPTGQLSAPCRAALVDMFADPKCSSADIVRCTTQSASIFQWRLLCMSGVLHDSSDNLFNVSAHADVPINIDWSKVHPAASSYLDLWTSNEETSAAFGPVGQAVLKRHQDTRLLVLELAQAPYIDYDLQAVFHQLARHMGFKPEVLHHTRARATKVAAASLPGGTPDLRIKASPLQNNNPFNVMTIPIVGSHPLQNFARFQTVYVGTTSTAGQYNFLTPPQNSIAINTEDKDWVASITSASGYLAEGSDFKMVYSAASAADTMSAKAEATFNGWGVDVSAEFSKTESHSSSTGSLYFDYWTKKIFNPDPSNLKEFGIPLTEDMKAELRAAFTNNRMEDFYQKWGNFVVFGFTRVVRFSSKIGLRFQDTKSSDNFTANVTGKYNGLAMSISAAAQYTKTNEQAKSGLTLTATRDVLPVGFQDADALQAAKDCTLPPPVLNSSSLDDVWVGKATANLATCAKGIGVPTATQGDRTHALLVPLAYLADFQKVIYEVQKAANPPPIQPLPGTLLADLARIGADPEIVIRLQRVWGRGKQLQRNALPYVGQDAKAAINKLPSFYGQIGNYLRVNLTQAIRDGIKASRNATLATPCDASGCELVIQTLNAVDLYLSTTEQNFIDDLAFLRDGLEVYKGALKLKNDAARKLTWGTLARDRVEKEAERLSKLADALSKGDQQSGFTSRVTLWNETGQSGAVVFDKCFADTFYTGMWNHTNGPPLSWGGNCTQWGNCSCVNGTLQGMPVELGHNELPIIYGADRVIIRSAVESGYLPGLNTTSSMFVGDGLVVTLFGPNITVTTVKLVPVPVWWPIFWTPFGTWFTVLYPTVTETTVQPRMFFAAGTYIDLGAYLQNFDDYTWAFRVDRVSGMTANRKQAMMERAKQDWVAAQQLLDATPGDTAKR